MVEGGSPKESRNRCPIYKMQIGDDNRKKKKETESGPQISLVCGMIEFSGPSGKKKG